MAIETKQQVLDYLGPAGEIDSDLENVIDRQIEGKTAIQGWIAPLTDVQKLYVAALAARAMIPRLLLLYSEEMLGAEADEEKHAYQQRIDFLKQLDKQIQAEIKDSGSVADPDDVPDDTPTPPPLAGIRAI